MKRIFAILLACLLLVCGTAMAEGANERTRTIVIEGVEETITEYEYISPSGYTMWVDGSRFVATDDLGLGAEVFSEVVLTEEANPQVMVLLMKTDIPVDQAESYIGEAVASYPASAVGELQHVLPDGGTEYYKLTAQQSGVLFNFYTFNGGDGLLCVTAAYPMEMAEGYGARIDAMLGTVTFPNAGAQYTGAGYTLTYNEALVKPAVFAGTEHDYFVPAGTAEGESPAASMLIVPSDVAWEDAESFLGEAVAMYPEESITAVETVSGSVEYMTRAATEQGMTYRFYAVKAPEGLLCITAVCAEGNTSFEGVFRDMIESIAFN